jgi:hypothetical protein
MVVCVLCSITGFLKVAGRESLITCRMKEREREMKRCVC